MKIDKDIYKELQKIYKPHWNRLYKEAIKASSDSNYKENVLHKINESILYRDRRKEKKPKPYYNNDLPVTRRRNEIVKLIKENQVVIISGQTGSGKTTQIPKFCLEAGCGNNGVIACTQPRRIAAVSVATRLAEELKKNLGEEIGYKIRFTEKFSNDGYIKVLTDGMLLAETQNDKYLNQYDCIIIDEAHERSLNIDFILGILRNLIKKRKDLKIIITSATIDTEKFSKAFDNAPVVEVSGRTFPVEVRYNEELSLNDELGYGEKCSVAAKELLEETYKGDILIFLPTEQDIKECIEDLSKDYSSTCDILPLYARLPQSEQSMVFKSTNRRKIIVSTNVAETSLTIPGIKYVIDSGVARISKYSPKTRTMGLPIDPVSKSSADQRKGRCGRVENGICIRLFSEADYNKRSQFTPPEIQRTNLAEVILRMINLGLEDIKSFPFIDSPPVKGITDGFNLLKELGAIKDSKGKISLTKIGRIMASYPIDPRDSRMIIEAFKEGCVREVTALAAVISVHDPRVRPDEKSGKADIKHNAFKNDQSDFITLLNIWKSYNEVCSSKSSSRGKIKKWCTENFISYRRAREWKDIYNQLMELNAGSELKESKTGDTEYNRIHRSVLSGYLSSIAHKKEKNFYKLSRDREGMLYPGSVLFNNGGEWIVSFEQVKTSRLFLRTAGNIDVNWLETLGGDNCKKSYSSPWFSLEKGEVRALEKVTLFGLTIVYNREVSYGRYNKKEANEIFIKECLVEGNNTKAHRKEFSFLDNNLKLIDDILKMENKLRQKNILVDPTAIEKFYKDKIKDVSGIVELRKLVRDNNGDSFLYIDEEYLYTHIPGGLDQFPDSFVFENNKFKIEYNFDPGRDIDGVTIKIPARKADQIPREKIDLAIPGLLKERITYLIKSLPKEFRKRLMPINQTVEDIMENMEIRDIPIYQQLSNYIYKNWMLNIPVNVWDESKIPEHLRVRLSIVDEKGRELDSSRDINVLYSDYNVKETKKSRTIKSRIERKDIKEWDFESPIENEVYIDGLNYYPGLKIEGNSLSLVLFDSKEDAGLSHSKGVVFLIVKRLNKQVKAILGDLEFDSRIALVTNYFKGEKTLLESLSYRAVMDLAGDASSIRNTTLFNNLSSNVSLGLPKTIESLFSTLNEILVCYIDAREAFVKAKETLSGRGDSFLSTVETELNRLMPVNFMIKTENFSDKIRFLQGLTERIGKGANNLGKDMERSAELKHFTDIFDSIISDLSPAATTAKLGLIGELEFLLEEYRLLLFSQNIRRREKVSDKRLNELIDRIKITI